MINELLKKEIKADAESSFIEAEINEHYLYAYKWYTEETDEQYVYQIDEVDVDLTKQQLLDIKIALDAAHESFMERQTENWQYLRDIEVDEEVLSDYNRFN